MSTVCCFIAGTNLLELEDKLKNGIQPGTEIYRKNVLEGVSLCIDNDDYMITEKEIVPVEKIRGIIVDKRIGNKDVSEISPLNVIPRNRVLIEAKRIREQLIEKGSLESEFDGIDELIKLYDDTFLKNSVKLGSLIETDNLEHELRNRIGRILSRSIAKRYQRELGQEHVTVNDVINHYNRNNLPIQDAQELHYGNDISVPWNNLPDLSTGMANSVPFYTPSFDSYTKSGNNVVPPVENVNFSSIAKRDSLSECETVDIMLLASLLDKKAKLQGYRDIIDYRIRAKLGKEIPVESLDAETQQKIDKIQAQIDALMKGKDK